MARSRASSLTIPPPMPVSVLAKSAWHLDGGQGREQSRRKTKVKCHVYVMLPYSPCSSLFCALLLLLLALFHFTFCLPFLSFFFIFLCVLRLFFCFYLFGNISLTLTFRTPLINSKTSWRSLLQLPLPFPPLPCVLAPTRRFMTFTFMTGICASVCVRVCPFCCCMQAWKAAEILICYFIAYTQRVLRCIIYGPAASTRLEAWHFKAGIKLILINSDTRFKSKFKWQRKCGGKHVRKHAKTR